MKDILIHRWEPVHSWLLLSLFVGIADQFLFVCLSWIVLSESPLGTAVSVLTVISLARLLAFLLVPSLSTRLPQLSIAALGISGRLLAMLLLLSLTVAQTNPVFLLGALLLFAVSDGLFIPVSSVILRALSAPDTYVGSLALMQIAVNIALAFAAIMGGLALEWTTRIGLVTLLALMSILNMATFLFFFRRHAQVLRPTSSPVALSSGMRAVLALPGNKTAFGLVFILELMVAGSLNVLFPRALTSGGYSPSHFGYGIALFVVTSVLCSSVLVKAPRIVAFKYYLPLVLLLPSIAYSLVIAHIPAAYFFAFSLLGASAAFIAPFLSNRLANSVSTDMHPLLFTLFSITSYSAIFMSYSLSGLMLYISDTNTVLTFSALTFFVLAVLSLQKNSSMGGKDQ
ncbi:hypothetical protein [Schaalia canis]|uniref:MFS transporter n=1 Tax=Schaalia canis TaxID=100469 RepID=A0A3P1SGT9_9ACTO|nr:hypothetical protein [Schaalia canis]RRC96160.1 hypothetical protein EII11_00330 [Schaalia canis]